MRLEARSLACCPIALLPVCPFARLPVCPRQSQAHQLLFTQCTLPFLIFMLAPNRIQNSNNLLLHQHQEDRSGRCGALLQSLSQQVDGTEVSGRTVDLLTSLAESR